MTLIIIKGITFAQQKLKDNDVSNLGLLRFRRLFNIAGHGTIRRLLSNNDVCDCDGRGNCCSYGDSDEIMKSFHCLRKLTILYNVDFQLQTKDKIVVFNVKQEIKL